MSLLRVIGAVFAVASLMITLARPGFILLLIVISWGAPSGSFIAPYDYGLNWRKSNRVGAIDGMVSGLGTPLVPVPVLLLA